MKFIKWIYLTLCILFLVWIFVSWIYIVSDNMSANPVHSAYNFFILTMK